MKAICLIQQSGLVQVLWRDPPSTPSFFRAWLTAIRWAGGHGQAELLAVGRGAAVVSVKPVGAGLLAHAVDAAVGTVGE